MDQSLKGLRCLPGSTVASESSMDEFERILPLNQFEYESYVLSVYDRHMKAIVEAARLRVCIAIGKAHNYDSGEIYNLSVIHRG